ncbi:hypothetical protein EJB05_21688 [Eragrostis curvula]|uniref:Uncharacterized protein n=1 Tax=Eragrostis curvula TaxID=38414 RepID=A0A5J9V1K9_9POAL|nr:hypothetical protein EJB05_21688 [Eragrostis curvula]
MAGLPLATCVAVSVLLCLLASSSSATVSAGHDGRTATTSSPPRTGRTEDLNATQQQDVAIDASWAVQLFHRIMRISLRLMSDESLMDVSTDPEISTAVIQSPLNSVEV